MRIAPLTAGHLHRLYEQGEHAMMKPLLADPTYAPALIAAGPCFVGLDGDRIIGAAGITRWWEGRAMAWAMLLSNISGPYMIQIHRATRAFLDSCSEWRIEAAVDHDFIAAHRWVRMLGFSHEYLAEGYLTDRRPADLYVRLRL